MFPRYLWLAVVLLATAVPPFLLAWRHRKWLFSELVLVTAAVVCLCEALAWVDFAGYLRFFREESLSPKEWLFEFHDCVWQEHGWWIVASAGVALVCSALVVLVLRFRADGTNNGRKWPMRWRMSAGILVTALAVVMSHWAGFIRPTPPLGTVMESQSRSGVFAGMQVAVRSLRREGDKLHLGYTFRWVGNNRSLLLRSFGRIGIEFWDGAGNNIASDLSAPYCLTRDFRCGEKANVFEDSTEVDIPVGVKFVSIDLVGIVTCRVAIPE